MKKKLVLFVLLAVLATMLSSCKKQEELIVGYTVYEPMNYTDSNGVFTGFDTELAVIVCEKLGVKPNFVEIIWETKEVELNAGNIDCVWNGLTITEERKQNMSITIPYVQNAQVVVMKAGSDYKDTSSLIGKNVCAEAGSAGESTIKDNPDLSKANFVAMEVQTACLLEVAAGASDAAVLDLTLANAMIRPDSDYANLAIVDRLDIEFYGIAFKNGSELTEKVNGILRDLMADGTLQALADKYNLELAK